MNKVIMMGRIASDLELKTTPSGVSVCKFRIAVDRNYQKKGEEKKTDFFNVTAWRGTAEFISSFFGKGRMILIDGEMQTQQYTDKNGNPATWYDIMVDNAYFTGEKSNTSTPSAVAGNAQPQQAATQSAPQPHNSGQASVPQMPPVINDDDYPF